MNEHMSRALQKLAAVGLLLIAIGVAAALIVLPLFTHFNTLRQHIAQERELLARFEAFSANKPLAEAAASKAEAVINSGMFLAGGTDAVRTANLQALITDIAGQHGARLASARMLPAQDQKGLRFISVQVEMETDMRRLQAMILDLESRRPFLLIRSLSVMPASGRGHDNEELKVRMGIAGTVALTASSEAKL